MSARSVVVGRYRLDQFLRPDFDATTWRSIDLTAKREVVVCLVASETGSSARSRRAIAHPGLAPVLDVVRMRDGVEPPLAHADPRGDTFVVVEMPVGPGADDVVARDGAIAAPVAVRVALALANALAAVHASGSVHGGVTPAAVEWRPLEDGGPRLSLRGVSDGAVAYASPSRLCDGGPSRHDDAWALLGVLYFLVTGSPPFAAESPQALARRVLGGRPIPLKGTSPGDVALQKIFDRGFSRTASQRYAEVAALREDLRAWLSEHGAGTPSIVPSQPPPDEAPERTTADPFEVPQPDAVEQPAYPRLGATPAERHKTIPFGRVVANAAGETSEEGAKIPSVRPPSIPAPPRVPQIEAPSPSPSPSPPAVRASTPPTAKPPSMRPSAPPEAKKAPPPVAEETARFSRDQLELLENERVQQMLADEDEARNAALPPLAATTPGTPLSKRPPARSTPPKPVPRAKPSVVRTSSEPPSSGRTLALAFGAGLVIAIVAGTAYFALKPASNAHSTRDDVARSNAPPPPAVPTSAPRHPVAASPSSASAPPSAPPSASAAPPRPADPNACVARWFPPETFTSDQDLSFVCSERSVRAGDKKLQRAIVAGAKGQRISEAMREWSSYRWYDSVVYATLRDACCPGAEPVETPKTTGACSSVADAIEAIATAAASGAPIDDPVKQFRRTVACVASNGDAPAFGQDGPMQGGEETAFRAFVARGTK